MEAEAKKQLHEALCNEGLALPENFKEVRQEREDRLFSYGISQKEIDTQLNMELELDFRNKGDSYHTAFPGLLTWSYGTVEKDGTK